MIPWFLVFLGFIEYSFPGDWWNVVSLSLCWLRREERLIKS